MKALEFVVRLWFVWVGLAIIIAINMYFPTYPVNAQVPAFHAYVVKAGFVDECLVITQQGYPILLTTPCEFIKQ